MSERLKLIGGWSIGTASAQFWRRAQRKVSDKAGCNRRAWPPRGDVWWNVHSRATHHCISPPSI